MSSEVVNRWHMLLLKSSVCIISTCFKYSCLTAESLVENYITHDAVKRVPPIRESQWATHIKPVLSSAHSHEALALLTLKTLWIYICIFCNRRLCGLDCKLKKKKKKKYEYELWKIWIFIMCINMLRCLSWQRKILNDTIWDDMHL